MKKLFYLMITMFFCGSLIAQESITNTVAKEQMQKFSDLAGQWRGSGYAIIKGGLKKEFIQTEVVQYKLDGTTMLIEGKGYSIDDSTKVVHHALGLLYYDPARQGFFFDGHLAQASHTYAKAKIDDEGRLIWWFEIPSGDTIRYIIEFTDSKWIEKGFYIRKEGGDEMKIFQMELDKVNSL